MKYLIIRIANGLAWGISVIGYMLLLLSIGVNVSPDERYLVFIVPAILLFTGIGGIFFINKTYGHILDEKFKASLAMRVIGYILIGFGGLLCFGGISKLLPGFFAFSGSDALSVFLMLGLFGFLIPGGSMIFAGVRSVKRHQVVSRLMQ
jgi:hypothetical protein